MCPSFSGGVSVNYPHGKTGTNGKPRKKPTRYLRVQAGPQRGKYVHDLIMEAVLGRGLEKDETVEHRDGNGLNCGFHADGKLNLVVVTKSMNTHLRHQREQRARRLGREAEGQANLAAWAEQF
jgi:hypothetical protein